jgi:hypothetical protein
MVETFLDGKGTASVLHMRCFYLKLMIKNAWCIQHSAEWRHPDERYMPDCGDFCISNLTAESADSTAETVLKRGNPPL